MELEKLEATIEAVLFAMGNAVSVEKIATAIGHDTETTRKLVHQMMDRYNQREGGLEIIELDDAFQLCTRREYYDALIRVAKQPKKYVLTDVQLGGVIDRGIQAASDPAGSGEDPWCQLRSCT